MSYRDDEPSFFEVFLESMCLPECRPESGRRHHHVLSIKKVSSRLPDVVDNDDKQLVAVLLHRARFPCTTRVAATALGFGWEREAWMRDTLFRLGFGCVEVASNGFMRMRKWSVPSWLLKLKKNKKSWLSRLLKKYESGTRKQHAKQMSSLYPWGDQDNSRNRNALRKALDRAVKGEE